MSKLNQLTTVYIHMPNAPRIRSVLTESAEYINLDYREDEEDAA